jgi:SAM-dependent methyltransferase
MDPFASFKEMQKQGWAHFAPLENVTTPAAPGLVRYAGIRAGQRVLDVACGTGVVAVTAARIGAQVTGLDLTPELLVRARENSQLAEVEIDWHQGDVEDLPFADAMFDVVVSQFGHIFGPRPEVTVAQMLRVLKPGGTIAFSTWPPDGIVGRSFVVVGQYAPPPPTGAAPPPLWGEPAVIRERLGAAVKNIVFNRGTLFSPALSPAHNRALVERTAGPIRKLVESLSVSDPARLAQFRAEMDALAADFFENNVIRQDFLMTRATKA